MKNAELARRAKEVLTKTEYRYFTVMNAQYLVPFIKGFPGTAKTSIAESIANKLGMVYVDLRCTTMDETDAGLYPFPVKGPTNITSLSHLPPKWAVAAIENPTINYLFAFEELNRATSAIRNAVMGILLERRVGFELPFGNNVFMIATGNIGEADGTEVEELDAAQRSRFIHFEHKLEYADWVEDYAKGKVHKDIIKFLDAKPAQFYPKPELQKNECPVDPRRWTALSNYIVSNTEKGMDSTIDDYDHLLNMVGPNFIGGIYAEFRKFTMEGRMLTLADVLAGRKKGDYSSVARENRAEVINELKADTQDPLSYTKKQTDNLKEFLLFMRENDHDILAAYMYDAGHLVSAKLSEKYQGKSEPTKTEILKFPFMNMVWSTFEKEWDYIYTNRAAKTEPTK